MKITLGTWLRTASGPRFLSPLLVCGIVYSAIEALGLFRLRSAAFADIVNSLALRALGVIIFLGAAAGLARTLFTPERAPSGDGAWPRPFVGLYFLSLLLLSAGVWLSALTRFEV